MLALSLPIISTLAALLANAALASGPADALARVGSAELREHDARVDSLKAELTGLPLVPEAQNVARVGWHSSFSYKERAADMSQSVTLDLGASGAFDSVVLVPVNVVYGSHPGPGYGFPVRFRIESAEDAEFSMPLVLGDFSGEDFPNPGSLPVCVSTPGAKGRFVRVTATRLFSRGSEALFALGELMVWHGPVNLSAGAPCRTSSNYQNAPTWQPGNLTDGQTVLGPPVLIEPTPGNGYHSLDRPPEFVEKWVQFDLGSIQPIDEVRIFAARPRDFPVRSGFGFPKRFRVEASESADFAQRVVLAEFADADCESPGDNPFVVAARGIPARYVRMTATRLWERNKDFAFALSEMEVFSGGRNLAPGATASALEDINQPNWKLTFLNDGFTSTGRLMDWNSWLRGLSRRREVMQELSVLDAAREPLVTAAFWRLGKWTAFAAGGLALFGVWWSARRRRVQRLELAKLRQRIAGDLHDEIGSNLGSIAMLANLAADHGDNKQDLAEIQRIAQETADSMRDIVWLIHPRRGESSDLAGRMREISLKQLAGSECVFEAEGVCGPFPLDFERQVMLLFKEALNNIRKHARARRIGIRLTQNGREFSLLIADDGAGFDLATPGGGHGLVSMNHRAGLIGATLTVQSSPGKGTHLALHARIP